MTIAEVIRIVDKLRPNAYSYAQKAEWIGQLETQIYDEIVSTHENYMQIRRPCITKDTEPDHRLIAPVPHDKVYEYYLESLIDLNNQEIGKYNNTSTMFNNALMTLRDYWNRTHMPKENVESFKFTDRRQMMHGHPIHGPNTTEGMLDAAKEANIAANKAREIYDELRALLQAGAFNGTNGRNGQQGPAGATGPAGFSPSVEVQTITGGYRLTITDSDCAKVFDLMDGQDGEDGDAGADGVSPTVEVQTITGGHKITITDKDGAHSFDVMDGEDQTDLSDRVDGIEANLTQLTEDMDGKQDTLVAGDNVTIAADGKTISVPDVTELKEETAQQDRRITNLEAAAQGKLYTGYTDSTAANTKTVPINALPWASVDSIGGKCQKVVQILIKTVCNTTFHGITFTNNNLNEVYLNGTSDSTTAIKVGTVSATIVGHKYLIYCNSNKIKPRLEQSVDANYGSKIETANNSSTSLAINIDTGITFTNKTIKFCVFDLTAMGLESITTVDEFRALFPNDYYDYTEGSILTADVESVKVNGANLIQSYASYSSSVLSFNGKDQKYIQFDAGTYTFSCNSNGKNVRMFYFTENTASTAIGYATNALTFTINEPFALWLYYSAGLVPEDVSDVILCKGNAAVPFVEYHAPTTHTIPSAVLSLTGYGWSAGTAFNEVDFENKKYIQRVGKVDLGTLSWTLSGEYFWANLASKPMNNNNLLCAKYSTSSSSENGTINGYSTSTRIAIYDNSYSDAASFKTAMNGVMLYYELATPVETDISNLLTWDGSINVEGGGTIEFHNSNGLDLAVPNKESYLLKVVSE